MRNPPLMVLAAVVDTEATLRAEPLERVGCLAFIAVATSPIPVKVMLLDALSVDAATDATLKALLVVRAFCFVLTAAAAFDQLPAAAANKSAGSTPTN